ncbi:MAG: beta-ketoacyl-ACP synthase [bacterium]|nr:beta-ketoacyl-ACP synthase [bacterium]MCP5069902.1 beta-ketoacyl-ACP synthase [bacterium]
MSTHCSLGAMGLVQALGADASGTWPRLLEGDQTRLSHWDMGSDRPPIVVASVRDDLPEIPASLSAFACRNNAMALAALFQIEEPLREAIARFGASRVGVVMGTSTSGVSDAELAIRHHLETESLAPSFDYAQLEFGGIADFTARWLGAEGPAYTLSTACSSGARALASARSMLRLGFCDAVVAGAADTLCGLTTGGFSSLQAIAPEPTNPMSVNRRGLTLGEGAAVFLVTRETGDGGGVRLAGVGESSEAHHMSAPDPDGRGAETAIRLALEDAEADPSDIAYVNLHGTGTALNDAMESAAVERVLGREVACSSTKPMTGHTLGAAGAIEAAFSWLVLEHAQNGTLSLPPHVYDGEFDPACAPIHLAHKGETVGVRGRALVLTSSFGFGGNNCCLVLERKLP